MENNTTPLTIGEKVFAGLILILFTSLSIIMLAAYWPDTVKNDGEFCYKNKAFHVMLITKDSCCGAKTSPEVPRENTKPANGSVDTLKKPKEPNPTDTTAKPVDSAATDTLKNKGQNNDSESNTPQLQKASCTAGKIHLNTLVLLLVGAGGFLGNMIYVGKSFTAFVGVGRFDRNWLLWYFVKPFIAAGLAIVVYLAFNAMPAMEKEIINLNRIVAIAALTGLFTDIALLKLKDVFEVIIKPTSDKTVNAPKKMTINVNAITPVKIDVNAPNQITIPGENLQTGKIVVKIEDVSIPTIVVTPNFITVTYTVPVADREKTTFQLEITDDKGSVLGSKVLSV